MIVSPVSEDETCPAVRGFDAPTREDPRDFDDVLLSVPAVDAQGVELEELARIVLVDACRLAPPIFRHFVHAEPAPLKQAERTRRRGTGGYALCIIEVEQHR